MIKEVEITVTPDKIDNQEYIKNIFAKKIKRKIEEISGIVPLRRSIDARGKFPVFKIKSAVYVNEKPAELYQTTEFKGAVNNKTVGIIGSGPAGLFSALKLLEHGYKPIIFERGKDVQERRRDLRAIQQEHIVNEHSNYCFGEGGAGTYSDGKLYTRSTKRGNVKSILNLLVQFGAVEDILYDAHPHIGSNKLPKIVQLIREEIIKLGGEVKFNSHVTDIIVEEGVAKGVVVNNNEEISVDSVILATGHSARDIYTMLNEKGILLEAKSFAMGVRIEHPQPLIDEIQYSSQTRHENLPAAAYALNCQVGKRGVYSFCMCPGGIIIPASTAPGELVLNGMSVSRRDSPFANSGLVVAIEKDDWLPYEEHGVMAGVMYQQMLEKAAFKAGGATQKAPAQRVTDFLKRKTSNSLPDTSYIPGTVSSPLHDILPKNISGRLAKALKEFDKKMHGYITEESQMLAAETRTSSPIRIPRDDETLQHPEVKGLYPCGEGAGYAGGIVSAAIDGERCAEAVIKSF